MPKPRNDSVATVNIAYPSRTVNSTRIGAVTFGQDLGEHDVGRALAAQAGRRHVVELALEQHRGPHRARDQRREHDPDHEDDHAGWTRPSARSRRCAVTISGSARNASTMRLITSSTAAAEVAHDEAERACPATVPRIVASGAMIRMSRAPDDHAREHVAAELVGAEPVRARRAPC